MERCRRAPAPGDGVPAAGDAAALGVPERALRARRRRRGRRRASRHATRWPRSAWRHVAHRPARVLSGGEQQRLALARAWALHPEVLFLDEPTASLDPTATREIEAVIRAFDAAGTKIVMATHNLGQARRLGDEVIYLHQGRMVERAPVETFFVAAGHAGGGCVHQRRAAMGLMRALFLFAAVPFVRSRCAAALHHRRLDHLDRAVGPVQAPAADLREEDRHPGARSGAGHRPGARHGTARRRRRSVRPCAPARGEVRRRRLRRAPPRGDVQRLRAHRAEVGSGGGRAAARTSVQALKKISEKKAAVRLARRPQRHAFRRARAVEGRGHRHRAATRETGIARSARAWGRRSTPPPA